jgi:ankyrin repeat protein
VQTTEDLDPRLVEAFVLAAHGDAAMVAWLLARGVGEVNSADFAGQTPLRAALERGDTASAELLRRHGGRE